MQQSCIAREAPAFRQGRMSLEHSTVERTKIVGKLIRVLKYFVAKGR